MKRILKSKTLYLILLFCINVTVLIILCCFSFNNNKSAKDFIPSGGNSFEPTTTSRYTIQKRDFTVYDSYDADILATEKMYSKYTVGSTKLSVGDRVDKDEVLGTNNGGEIHSISNSICIDIISESENKKVLTFYNFNEFTITISLTTYQFGKIDFSSLENIYFSGNGNNYSVTFSGYDFDHLETESIIKANFIPVDCYSFITLNSEVSIKLKQTEYLDQLCLPATVFDNNLFAKTFYVVDDDKYKSIYIESIAIVDDYALIEAGDYTIMEGMYVYL